MGHYFYVKVVDKKDKIDLTSRALLVSENIYNLLTMQTLNFAEIQIKGANHIWSTILKCPLT